MYSTKFIILTDNTENMLQKNQMKHSVNIYCFSRILSFYSINRVGASGSASECNKVRIPTLVLHY